MSNIKEKAEEIKEISSFKQDFMDVDLIKSILIKTLVFLESIEYKLFDSSFVK